MKPFEKYDDQDLIDLVFDTNLTHREMAEELNKSEAWVRTRIKFLGLGWVRRQRGCASRGQASLMAMMRKLLPGEDIVAEYPLSDRLKLDVYCKKYELAAEFHGRQHFEFVHHFHGDIYGFEESKRRDQKKLEICRDLGIALVIFRYNDELTEDAIFARLLDALQNTPVVTVDKQSQFKGNPYYEAMKNRQREYRKKAYEKMKARNGRRH